MPSFRLRRLTAAPWVQKTIGVVGAEYLRFVWRTSRYQFDPPNVYEIIEPEFPVIIAMWHGQHFLLPFVKKRHHRAKTLISHHRDGAINAAVAKWLGVDVIRGSGTHGSDFDRKGSVSAFREMLDALDRGYNVALTADVPKVSRVCGLGIVKLASMSGRSIYTVAIASGRRIVMNNWDRSVVPLPFGLGAVVVGAPVSVPRDADHAQLEATRRAVEHSLNEVNERAYAAADGTKKDGARG